jgi:oligoribonuclease
MPCVLAWMDLEMTGLDPARHIILEIATLVTDDDLTVVAEGPDLVVSATTEQLAEMDDYVRAMHTGSGLLSQVEASTLTLGDAGAATLDFLKEHLGGAGKVPLAGNSIGTDRRFLAAYLPEVEHFLSYRCVDVSTVKELAQRWFPDVLAGAPHKRGAHRAMGDIKESVAELAYYRQQVFRPPAATASTEADGDPGTP